MQMASLKPIFQTLKDITASRPDCSEHGGGSEGGGRGADRQPDHHQLQHGATVRRRLPLQQHRQARGQRHAHQGHRQRHLRRGGPAPPGVPAHQLAAEDLPTRRTAGAGRCQENCYRQKVTRDK